MRHFVLLAAGAAVSLLVGCGATAVDPSPETANPVADAPGPTTFETGSPIVAIATSPTHVCWTSFAREPQTASVVACASKSDGRVVALARDALVHPWLALSGGEVFWSTEVTATIERASVTGGSPAPFVTKSGPHGRFVLQNTTAYWLVDGGAGAVLFSASTGPGSHSGESARVANLGPADPDLLAVDDHTVYDYATAYTFANGVVQTKLATSSAEPTKLSQGCFYPVALLFDAGRVLVSCQDGTFHSVSLGKNGVPDERVLTGIGGGPLAAKGDGRAYVTAYPGGTVRRVNLETGSADTIASDLKSPTAIAVDESGVYVGDGSTIRRFAP